MNRLRSIGVFLAVSFLLSAAVYKDAMWGGSMLAPLDLGPDLLSQYSFMDPAADGIPDNHYIIDQFTYDLPLQYRVYESYHAGEIPWWDPYTYGGRPLLADAHVNGTDPIRLLCYAALPFELAYNWNYILRGIVTGLGMFLLLRHFGVGVLLAVIFAITYQFAGWFTLYFGHPWIQGSFVYFPFIWIAWLRAASGDFSKNAAVAAVFCGLVFYSGNLQSHTYLPIFACTFMAACFFAARQSFLKALSVCAISGLIGALLAWPVLFNQIEFYLLSIRAPGEEMSWLGQLLKGAALTGVYPWAFGTFRTMGVGRLFGGGNLSFNLFFGSVAWFLAFYAAWSHRRDGGKAGWIVLQSLFLILVYLVIVATPLSQIFYPRSACLAGMGLILLAGIAAEDFISARKIPSRKAVGIFASATISAAVGSKPAGMDRLPHVPGTDYEKSSGSRSFRVLLRRSRNDGKIPHVPDR